MKRSELKEKIEDGYYWIYNSIKQFFRNLSRALVFAKIGWSNYDYDYAYLLDLMRFKLERMEKEILNGYGEPDKKTNQSIRICIKLLKKIAHRDYHYFIDLHYTKWGQPELEHLESDEKGYSRVSIKHEKAITENDKELQTKEFLEAYAKDQKQEERDTRLLFAIMAKYHKRWWD